MTYEIKYEPVIIGGISRPKYNIYYTGGPYDGAKEFHSLDGVVTEANTRAGYINVSGPKWSAMYEALLGNDALILKMLSVTVMSGHLASVYAILQRGVDGFPNESRLSYLLNRPGWNWTGGEKTTMNNYFIAHNFVTRIT